MDKKEQTRLRVKRYRERQGSVTQTGENVTQSPNSVTNATDNVTLDVTHPVMKWLTDPVLRPKLEAIVKSLANHHQLPNVYLGYGRHSLPLDIVGEMLEVTQ